MTEAGGQQIRIGGVQVYPTWDGGGTVKCSVVDADDMPFTDPAVLALIQAEIDPANNSGAGIGMAPIGAEVTITTPTSQTINVSATVSHSSGTIESITTAATEAINNYLAEVRSEWGIAEISDPSTYVSNVYIARVTAAILGVTGVTNVTTVKLNNAASDVSLTENATTQQVPVLGTVSLTEG